MVSLTKNLKKGEVNYEPKYSFIKYFLFCFDGGSNYFPTCCRRLCPTTNYEWSAPIPLANQNGYDGIAGSGNVVHAVYSGFEPSATPSPGGTPVPSTSPIMYRRSIEESENFGTPVPINGAFGALYLEDTVIADGDLVAVCYYSNFQVKNDFAGARKVADIYIVVSDNGGITFRAPVRLNTGATGFALRHSIAIRGQNIHVVWMDFRNNRWDIYYRRSTDEGVTWGEEDKLLVKGENSTGIFGSGAQRPQIAANGDTIHVAWMDGRDKNAACMIEGGTLLPQCTEIYYTKSTNNGTSFLETPPQITLIPLTASTTTPPTYAGRPDVVTDGSATVYVLYDKRTPSTVDNEIFFSKSKSGTPFEPPVQVTNATGVSTHSSGGFVNPTLWTIYLDSKESQNPNPNTPDYKVYSISYNGVNFGAEQTVSSSANAGAPILGASDTYIHAIWWNISNRTIRIAGGVQFTKA